MTNPRLPTRRPDHAPQPGRDEHGVARPAAKPPLMRSIGAGGLPSLAVALLLLGGCAAAPAPTGPRPIQVATTVAESEGGHVGAHLRLSLGGVSTLPSVGQACTLTKDLGKRPVSELLPDFLATYHVDAGGCEVTDIIRNATRTRWQAADGPSDDDTGGNRPAVRVEYHIHSAVVRITRAGLAELEPGSDVVLTWLPNPAAQAPTTPESAVEPTEAATTAGPQAGQDARAASELSDREPVPLLKVEPVYPRRALTRGIEGYVRVVYCVSPAGDVEDVQVVESAPLGIFDRAAVQAALQAKYQPKLVAGQPVEACGVESTLTFGLQR